MDKIYVQNLAMIITNKCNMNCAHCLRGNKDDLCMSKKVIKSTLRQIAGIGNLSICGGEPTLALDTLESIFNYVIDHNIMVEQVSVTINGTIYSLEFLNLLNYINEYITFLSEDNSAIFAISDDNYHIEELKRLDLYDKYLENVDRYVQSFYFYEMKKMNDYKVFREGNALNLDESLTKELTKLEMLLSYDERYKMCNIGPLIAISPEGIVTEADGSIENQKTIYNYGNVLNESLEKIVKRNGRVLSFKKMNKESSKLMKEFINNN